MASDLFYLSRVKPRIFVIADNFESYPGALVTSQRCYCPLSLPSSAVTADGPNEGPPAAIRIVVGIGSACCVE